MSPTDAPKVTPPPRTTTTRRLVAAAEEVTKHFRAGTGDVRITAAILELARAVEEARDLPGAR